jgi:two-component system chemotaxis response regulator CheB
MQARQVSLRFLDAAQGESHVIALNEGALLVVSAPSPAAAAGGDSFAVSLTRAGLRDLAARPQAVLDEAKRRWPKGGMAGFRLIGEADAYAPLEPALARTGLVAGKCAPLSTPVELHYFPREARVRARKTGDGTASTPVPSAPAATSATVPARKTRVLVVDDSETICKLLARVISDDPEFECVGTVTRPTLADAEIQRTRPDVITMDIHMPELDGVALLKRVLPKYRIPVIMISSLNREEGGAVLDALDAGAVDYIQKPTMDRLVETSDLIREKIRMARGARVAMPASAHASRPAVSAGPNDSSFLIVIGSSTGGTEALKQVLTMLPEHIPPILIVQHIPPVFSAAFADRMNQLCRFNVREARDGDDVVPDQVLIAPGGKQMKVKAAPAGMRIVIEDSAPVNRHKPSVDCLFDSVADLKPKKLVGAILTGMGADGAKGLLRLKGLGAHTIAQDEATCVVFGMPREAIRLGAAQEILPIDKIAERLLHATRKKERAA